MIMTTIMGGERMTQFDPRALAVLERLEAAGHRAVLVGGCVRDGLLSIPDRKSVV